MKKQDTFIDKCLAGEANIEGLNDYVEYWHTHDLDVSLREYLGLTSTEYEAYGWIGDSASLFKLILNCRKNNIDFSEDYYRAFVRLQDPEPLEDLEINKDEQ